MIVLHDINGKFIGLQNFPETTTEPHIIVDDGLLNVLMQLVGSNFQLDWDGHEFSLPANINDTVLMLQLEKTRTEKMQEIESAQMIELQQGVEFLFNGLADRVQTRSERDLINISGIATKAMLLKGKGIEQAVIEFRAESNTSYMLTPDDAIALGEAVADRNQQIYSKAWLLKDAINAAETLQELELLQW